MGQSTLKALVAALLTALIAAGLNIAVSPPAVAVVAAAADEPIDCEVEPDRCPPPPLLSQQLLQDSQGLFHATPEQVASLRVLEDQAVANTIHDYALPASDEVAVRSWGRAQAQAQLWALIVEAIRTDAAARSEDQRNVVAWMAQTMNRKVKEASINAGWEYLTWAGRVTATDPRPPVSAIIADLQRFADRTLQPVTYRNGTADTSDSGFCDYTPPVGMEDQYDGNASNPGSNAGAWCFPPLYQCGDPLGCDNRQPEYEDFVRWGEADVIGDPADEGSFASTANLVSRSLLFATAARGIGLAGFVLASSLGWVASGTALGKALLPYINRVPANISRWIRDIAIKMGPQWYARYGQLLVSLCTSRQRRASSPSPPHP